MEAKGDGVAKNKTHKLIRRAPEVLGSLREKLGKRSYYVLT